MKCEEEKVMSKYSFKIDIKDAKIDYVNDNYYLNLTYLCEDERGVYERNYPRIHIPIPKHGLPFVDKTFEYGCVPRATMRLGSEEFDLHADENGNIITETIIKPKIHELSISDIEKKLGYKIKIVGEKDD